MGLTVSQGDAFATFITGEIGSASVGFRRPLFAIGRGTGGDSTVIYARNTQAEDTYTRPADAQNALETTSSQPA